MTTTTRETIHNPHFKAKPSAEMQNSLTNVDCENKMVTEIVFMRDSDQITQHTRISHPFDLGHSKVTTAYNTPQNMPLINTPQPYNLFIQWDH